MKQTAECVSKLLELAARAIALSERDSGIDAELRRTIVAIHSQLANLPGYILEER